MENNSNNCPPPYQDSVFSPGPSGKSRGVAALLAIFLGTLGIQYFYVGKNTAGIITLIVSLCTCGIPSILWLIQGILMFTMSQQDFERKYVYSTSTFPLF
ncbi:TM2 domain-containing protein [Barnesiella sp. WM24]|uniref:TM2 domain-containing protein n=1 Tax=Barnesiella sp. WM24 TaxID=2558278 RepID=UPI001071F452|nr:TM2 domain-containing protein [Barnesiella sp. WM24]MDE6113592.1 TM2 domain-containing protein [Muribaculum sp.]TFU94490.1 TM2 domain-containing protein [Barnesiella sp. WM24]